MQDEIPPDEIEDQIKSMGTCCHGAFGRCLRIGMSPCLPSCDPSVGTLHRNSENSYSDIEIAIPDRSLLYFLRFDEHEIQHCRLLKITVPGSVLHILKGFKRSGCAFAERLISTTVAAPNWKRPVGVLRASTFPEPVVSRRKQCALDTTAPIGCEDPPSESGTPI